MSHRVRSLITAILMCAMATAVSAQDFEEPSHPLSQINPIDVPLNMSNEAVLNVSVLSLSNPSGNGFNIDNYAITDTTGANRLKFDPSQDQFQVQGSELNLSGNNLTAPDNIKTGGQSVTVKDSSSGLDILRAKSVAQGGFVDIPNGDLRVFDNRITGSEGRIGLSSSPDGVFLRADTGGVFLQRGGNDVLKAVGGGDIQIPDGNLNISGENITNIDTLKFEEGTSIDGDVTINGSTDITSGLNVTGELNLSGDLDLSNRDLEDVRNITGGGDEVEFQDAIDLKENQVLNADSFRDNTGVDTIRFDGSNNVAVPNGDLRLNGNNVVSNVEDNMRVETQRSLVLGGDTDSDGTGSGRIALQTRGNNRVFVTNSGQLEVQDNDLDLQGNRIVDDTSSNTVFVGDGTDDNVRLETGGKDVDVPSGDVDVSGGNVKNVNRVDFSNDEEIEEKNGDLCIGDRCA